MACVNTHPNAPEFFARDLPSDRTIAFALASTTRDHVRLIPEPVPGADRMCGRLSGWIKSGTTIFFIEQTSEFSSGVTRGYGSTQVGLPESYIRVERGEFHR
jgi:hypothetical protein